MRVVDIDPWGNVFEVGVAESIAEAKAMVRGTRDGRITCCGLDFGRAEGLEAHGLDVHVAAEHLKVKLIEPARSISPQPQPRTSRFRGSVIASPPIAVPPPNEE